MAKPTDFQKKVIEHLQYEMDYWSKSNDIHSPSHHTSIECDMLADFDEHDLGDGPRAKDLDAIAEKMAELHSLVAYLEPSGR